MKDLTFNEILSLFALTDKAAIEKLYADAYAVKVQHVGKVVHFRGIIEFSNYCQKDCYYCGIRKSNTNFNRYTMTKEEIVEAAIWAYKNSYGSVVLQSGERQDEKFVSFVEEILYEIKKQSDGKLGITLSLGEQSENTYQRWFKAGGHRYLLRIESSNPQLYAKLHPENHRFEKRVECLELLKSLGFQTGTGVMIGLPGQTLEDLANDVLFFKKMDVDMLGMGPFIPHHDTPLKDQPILPDSQRLELALKMIAISRIVLKDINIAASTALQALKEDGREDGIMAGANIIMPNVTETKYRPLYQLYDGKPCMDEDASMCRGCLELRIKGIGESIGLNQWGDSKHHSKKKSP